MVNSFLVTPKTAHLDLHIFTFILASRENDLLNNTIKSYKRVCYTQMWQRNCNTLQLHFTAKTNLCIRPVRTILQLINLKVLAQTNHPTKNIIKQQPHPADFIFEAARRGFETFYFPPIRPADKLKPTPLFHRRKKHSVWTDRYLHRRCETAAAVAAVAGEPGAARTPSSLLTELNTRTPMQIICVRVYLCMCVQRRRHPS